MQCRKLAKAVAKLAGMLENLQKTVGTKGAILKDERESLKLEIRQTQEMLQEAQKAHNEAIAKQRMFKARGLLILFFYILCCKNATQQS